MWLFLLLSLLASSLFAEPPPSALVEENLAVLALWREHGSIPQGVYLEAREGGAVLRFSATNHRGFLNVTADGSPLIHWDVQPEPLAASADRALIVDHNRHFLRAHFPRAQAREGADFYVDMYGRITGTTQGFRTRRVRITHNAENGFGAIGASIDELGLTGFRLPPIMAARRPVPRSPRLGEAHAPAIAFDASGRRSSAVWYRPADNSYSLTRPASGEAINLGNFRREGHKILFTSNPNVPQPYRNNAIGVRSAAIFISNQLIVAEYLHRSHAGRFAFYDYDLRGYITYVGQSNRSPHHDIPLKDGIALVYFTAPDSVPGAAADLRYVRYSVGENGLWQAEASLPGWAQLLAPRPAGSTSGVDSLPLPPYMEPPASGRNPIDLENIEILRSLPPGTHALWSNPVNGRLAARLLPNMEDENWAALDVTKGADGKITVDAVQRGDLDMAGPYADRVRVLEQIARVQASQLAVREELSRRFAGGREGSIRVSVNGRGEFSVSETAEAWGESHYLVTHSRERGFAIYLPGNPFTPTSEVNWLEGLTAGAGRPSGRVLPPLHAAHFNGEDLAAAAERLFTEVPTSSSRRFWYTTNGKLSTTPGTELGHGSGRIERDGSGRAHIFFEPLDLHNPNAFSLRRIQGHLIEAQQTHWNRAALAAIPFTGERTTVWSDRHYRIYGHGETPPPSSEVLLRGILVRDEQGSLMLHLVRDLVLTIPLTDIDAQNPTHVSGESYETMSRRRQARLARERAANAPPGFAARVGSTLAACVKALRQIGR